MKLGIPNAFIFFIWTDCDSFLYSVFDLLVCYIVVLSRHSRFISAYLNNHSRHASNVFTEEIILIA